MPVKKPPTRAQINTWRRYLANERAEAAVYRELARKREGAEREILLELAEAESRHERYWRDKLGDYVGMPRQPDLNTRVMGFMAKHFGSVFTLALMQTAESRSPYIDDADASPQIAADERMHAEVVRALAARGFRRVLCEGGPQLFGSFQAADLVDELCLTLAPVFTAGAAGRITAGAPETRLEPLRLKHVLCSGDTLLLRCCTA